MSSPSCSHKLTTAEMEIQKNSERLERLDIAYGSLEEVLRQSSNAKNKYWLFRQPPPRKLNDEQFESVLENTFKVLININKNIVDIQERLVKEFPEFSASIAKVQRQENCDIDNNDEENPVRKIYLEMYNDNKNKTVQSTKTSTIVVEDNDDCFEEEEKEVKDENVSIINDDEGIKVENMDFSCDTVILGEMDNIKEEEEVTDDNVEFDEIMKIVTAPSDTPYYGFTSSDLPLAKRLKKEEEYNLGDTSISLGVKEEHGSRDGLTNKDNLGDTSISLDVKEEHGSRSGLTNKDNNELDGDLVIKEECESVVSSAKIEEGEHFVIHDDDDNDSNKSSILMRPLVFYRKLVTGHPHLIIRRDANKEPAKESVVAESADSSPVKEKKIIDSDASTYCSESELNELQKNNEDVDELFNSIMASCEDLSATEGSSNSSTDNDSLSSFRTSITNKSDGDVSTTNTSSSSNTSSTSSTSSSSTDNDEPHHDFKECKVILSQLPLPEHSNNSSDANLEKLCDLSTLTKKRRLSTNEAPSSDRKKLKLKRNKRNNSSSNSHTSGSPSEDSLTDDDAVVIPFSQVDEAITSSLSAPDDQTRETAALIDGILNDSDDDNIVDSDGSAEVDKTKEKHLEYAEKTEERTKKKLTAEEKDKRKWRSDPLLNGKLSSDDSDYDEDNNDESTKKKNTNKRISIMLESGSDSDDCFITKTPPKNFKPIRIKRSDSSPSSSDGGDDSNDNNSEDEFENGRNHKKKKKSPDKSVIELSDDGNEPGSSGKKGRKNIRALIADEDLNEATQRARQIEQERITRLQQKSKNLEAILSQSDDTENLLVLDVDAKTGEPLITVDKKLCERLKEHQKEGVKFMWNSCFESVDKMKTDEGSGCILAHCMGLGKTFQVITLIHTLFTHEITQIRNVLVVCPLSTVSNWQQEFKIGLKKVEMSRNFTVYTLVGKNEDKLATIQRWGRSKSVLIVGYEAFEAITNEKKLDAKFSKNIKERLLSLLVHPGPDLIVCDEGHLLKNGTTLRTKALNKVSTKRRIVLTGTPIQNNLKEYYYMVQFVKPNLLGTYKEYNNSFVNPIENGQYDDSSVYDIHMMKRRTHVLQRILKETLQRVEVSELKTYLKDITDYAIFVQLHPVQIKLYKEFVSYALRVGTQKSKAHFLRDYQMLGLVCSHPYLIQLHEEVSKKLKKDGKKRVEHDTIEAIQDITQVNTGIPNEWWKSIVPNDLKENLEYGTKFKIMRLIIEECEAIGDKVLIFSQRRVELDAIEHYLQTVGTKNCKNWLRNWDYLRMDGEVPPAARSDLCDRFNNPTNRRSRVFIMSHRVGGLGLNLIAANRVILMSANFNPSYDTQSVYRAYRFGQTKACFVYRLLAKETMEEKVYQRCITKLAQAGRVVDKHQIQRHYNRDDVSEFYRIIPQEDVQRAVPNVPSDNLLAKILQSEESIFKFHEHEALLENRPEEDLTDTEKTSAWDEYNKNEEMKMAYAAQALVNLAATQNRPNNNIINNIQALNRPPTSLLPNNNIINNIQALNRPPTTSSVNTNNIINNSQHLNQRHIVDLSKLSTIVTVQDSTNGLPQTTTSPTSVSVVAKPHLFIVNSATNTNQQQTEVAPNGNKVYYVGKDPFAINNKLTRPNNKAGLSYNPFSRQTNQPHNIKGVVIKKQFVEKLLQTNKNVRFHKMPVLPSCPNNNRNAGIIAGAALSSQITAQNSPRNELLKKRKNYVRNPSVIGDTHITKLNNHTRNNLRKPSTPTNNKVAPFRWLNPEVKMYNEVINVDASTDKENKKSGENNSVSFSAIQSRISSNPNISLHPVTKGGPSDVIDLDDGN